MDWINLVIGAIIGWAMPYVIVKVRDIFHASWVWVAERMRKKIKIDGIKKVLSVHNPNDGLRVYKSTFASAENSGVCLLTKDEWLLDRIIPPFEKSVVRISAEDSLAYVQTDELLRTSDSKIFNGNICVVRSVPNDSGTAWELGNSDYYSYAHFRRKVLLSKYSPSFLLRGNVRRWLQNPLEVILAGMESIAVGASVALVHDAEEGEKEVLLHVRSKDVFVEPNMWSVLPCFGVETNKRMGYESDFGVLQYNFIRELGEELFGIPEIICSSNKYHPDWFVKHQNISKVVDDWKLGRFSLHLLGISIDPWNPSVHFSFVAYARELRFWNNYCKEGSLSWEVAHNRQGTPIVKFFKLSDQLLERSEGCAMTETSKFLISRMLEVMRVKHNS